MNEAGAAPSHGGAIVGLDFPRAAGGMPEFEQLTPWPHHHGEPTIPGTDNT